MTILIEVPPGLNGVAVTDTAIGDVDGEAGYYHYRGHDATALARSCSFEEVWHLVAVGHRHAVQPRGYIDQNGHGVHPRLVDRHHQR